MKKEKFRGSFQETRSTQNQEIIENLKTWIFPSFFSNILWSPRFKPPQRPGLIGLRRQLGGAPFHLGPVVLQDALHQLSLGRLRVIGKPIGKW